MHLLPVATGSWRVPVDAERAAFIMGFYGVVFRLLSSIISCVVL